jgi:hypothetical protein
MAKPRPPEKETEPSHGWLFSLFADPIKLLAQPIKLPGWAAILFAVFVFFPDWHARIEFWLHVVHEAGGKMSVLASAIASPYFSPALAAAGLIWVLFVGEPRGVQRHHWLRYVGWSVFLICATTVVSVAAYGALEVYIQEQVSSRDKQLQERAAVRPVFWHLTDAQKTALRFELSQVPEADRFEIKAKCLPDAGSRAFLEDLYAVLAEEKWKMTANCFFSNIRASLTGTGIIVSKKWEGKLISDRPKNIQTFNTMFFNAKIFG